MRFIFSLIVFLWSSSCMIGQAIWQPIATPVATQEGEQIETYQAATLDIRQLQQQLKAAPMEFTSKAKNQSLSLDLLMPDGDTKAFKVVESPVMEAGLAARYPEIKSYSGRAADGTQLRLSVSPRGAYAFLNTPTGIAYIKPLEENSETYVSYYLRDARMLDEHALTHGHKHHHHHHHSEEEAVMEHLRELGFGQHQKPEKTANTIVNLRVYRLALASTVRFSKSINSANPTVMRVLEVYNEIANVLNGVYEPEAAVRFVLIDRTDELIFTDTADEPFNSTNEGRRLISQAQNVFNNIIPNDIYDVGHVLTGNCTDVGGIARLSSACSSEKARGVSCRSSNNSILRMVLRILAHEMGHQFAATHTMSACGADENNQIGVTTYEPGSGSTIMSYAGSCGSDNVQSDSDDYFHGLSLEQIITYARAEEQSGCGEVMPTNNNVPELTLPYTSGFYIPTRTPFELTATASDPDGDALLYCWEQFDAGAINSGAGFINAASIRSYPPTSSPTRVIPRQQNLLTGSIPQFEQLPTFERDYTFRCTVRDNNPQGGGTVWEDIDFRVAGNAGPFLVTYPTAETDTLQAGQQVEVTWDVANTDNSLVNCQRVNILLSTDGGNTFNTTLLENVLNDGTEAVTLPDVQTTNARIRVEAANNIFFNVSRRNFPILEAEAATVAVRPAPYFQQLCLPETANTILQTEAIAGYEGMITFEVTNLPEGATATFEPTSIMAGESTNLTITFEDETINGLSKYDIQISEADGTPLLTQAIELNVISNDFSALALASPESGTRGILGITTFEWTALPNAVSYDFELASSPAFDTEDIITTATALTSASYFPEDVFLEDGKLFYWRVRPNNACGTGAYTLPNVFQTVNVQCIPFAQTEAVNIPGFGTPTVESVITINTSGIISDLNIPVINAAYPPMGFTEMTLVSPAGTSAVLVRRKCGNVRTFATGFDDEAPTELACPPNTGIVHIPQEPLSVFDGEDIQGQWKLQFKVLQTGFGDGSLDSWELESCATIEALAPELLTNEVFALPPNSRSQIWTTTLEAIDEDNSNAEVIYELLSAPQHGTLYINDTPLAMGDSFTQQDVDGYHFSYEHSGDDATEDSFDFIIRDTNGGWHGPDVFQIAIDEGSAVGTNDAALAQAIRIYPNPVSATLSIALEASLDADTQVRVFDVRGQQLFFAQAGDNRLVQVATNQFASGIYFVQIHSGDAFYTERIVVE
ncbi:MAG: reprolysin-like metallopeptidase [Bacteroidota bacterium]